MGILFGFAPFLVFFFLTRFTNAAVSLWSAAAVSAILLVREKLRGRSIKILEAGTLILFALLGCYSSMTRTSWETPVVRMVVDAGLLAIMALSLLIRRPFTLQYAREGVPEAVRHSPTFLKTNQIITSVWALAMALVDAADLSMQFVPGIPVRTEIGVIIAALGGALWFTKWYPEQVRHRSNASASRESS